MLLLTRKINESIILNDDIKIKILGTKGNQVRIGIEAPNHISVHREEIWLKIKGEEESKLS